MSMLARYGLLCRKPSSATATATAILCKEQRQCHRWIKRSLSSQSPVVGLSVVAPRQRLFTTTTTTTRTTTTISPLNIPCRNHHSHNRHSHHHHLLDQKSSFRYMHDDAHSKNRWLSVATQPGSSSNTTDDNTTTTDNIHKMEAFLHRLVESPTPKTIATAFELMDQFVLGQQLPSQSAQSSNSFSPPTPRPPTLYSISQQQALAHRVMQAWKTHYRRVPSTDFTLHWVFDKMQQWQARWETVQQHQQQHQQPLESASDTTTPMLLSCYNMILHNAALSRQPALAEDMFHYLIQLSSSRQGGGVVVSDNVFHETKEPGDPLAPLGIVLEAWTQSLLPLSAAAFSSSSSRGPRQNDAPERAEAVLQFAKTWWKEHGHDPQQYSHMKWVKPNRWAYNIVLAAWSKSDAVDAPERAQALYDEMIQAWQSSSSKDDKDDTMMMLKPNANTYALLMTTWGRKGARATHKKTGQGRQDRTGALQAQALFDEMLQHYNASNRTDLDFRPDACVYTALMFAWAKVGNAPRNQSILQHMEQLPLSTLTSQEGVKPNWVYAYNLTLDAWANYHYFSPSKTQDREAPRQAQALLEHMIQKSKSGYPELKPDMHSYSTLIKVWGRTQTAYGAAQAQRVFHEMLRQYRETTDNAGLRPTAILYGTLIDAWAKAKEPQKAEQVLRDMMANHKDHKGILMVDVPCFNAVMNAWARSGVADAAERTQALFDELVSLRPTQPHLIPDVVTFGVLITAWSRSARDDRAQQAERVFDMAMKHRCADVITLNALLDAWIKAGVVERAEAILRSMSEQSDRTSGSGSSNIQPNVASYNTVMYGWLRSNRPEAAERIQALYDDILQRSSSNKMGVGVSSGRGGKNRHRGVGTGKPDPITYVAVVTAWCNSASENAPAMAQAAFADMVRRCEAGDVFLKPEVGKLQVLIRNAKEQTWVKQTKK